MKSILPPMALLLAACDGSGAASSDNRPANPSETTIAMIQGDGNSSPLVGQTVSVAGIVSGDFQDNDTATRDNLGGFYLQSETPDDNPATSEGVFVYDGANPSTDVTAGDRVQVTGTVNEHFGETQLAASAVRVLGAGSVQALDINLPVDATRSNSDGDEIADLERFEGMLLRFPQKLTVANLRFLERFGEVGLAAGDRPQQFSNANPPDAADYAAHKRQLARRSIVLDDGQRQSPPSQLRHLFSGSEGGSSIRAGDTVTGLSGNLRYSRGSGASGNETWRLMPVEDVSFTPSNPRTSAPQRSGGLRVASLNVLNYFANIDDGSSICGPRDTERCRGADSTAEIARQTEKLVTVLRLLDADIVGLIELENDNDESVAMLVGALNARLGNEAYQYIDTGSIGDDVIKTALIYRPSAVQPRGDFAVLDRSVDRRFDDSRHRPALAQTFDVGAARLTISVNHFKSKGSDCAADGDPNRNDGQGNCNMTRVDGALALADWLQSDPTASGDDDVLIIGDLNTYLREDPLTELGNSGFTNLLSADTYSYTFLFDAQIGALDHALASASLRPQVAAVSVWHISADEPPLFDYNLENDRDPRLFDGDSPFRASDHDPVVIDFDLDN